LDSGAGQPHVALVGPSDAVEEAARLATELFIDPTFLFDRCFVPLDEALLGRLEESRGRAVWEIAAVTGCQVVLERDSDSGPRLALAGPPAAAACATELVQRFAASAAARVEDLLSEVPPRFYQKLTDLSGASPLHKQVVAMPACKKGLLVHAVKELHGPAGVKSFHLERDGDKVHVHLAGLRSCVQEFEALIQRLVTGDHNGLDFVTVQIDVGVEAAGKIVGSVAEEVGDLTGCEIAVKCDDAKAESSCRHVTVIGPPAAVKGASEMLDTFAASGSDSLLQALGPAYESLAERFRGLDGLAPPPDSEKATIERVLEVPAAKRHQLVGVRGRHIQHIREFSGVEVCRILREEESSSWEAKGTVKVRLVGTPSAVGACSGLIEDAVAGMASETLYLNPTEAALLRGGILEPLQRFAGASVEPGPDGVILAAADDEGLEQARRLISATLGMLLLASTATRSRLQQGTDELEQILGELASAVEERASGDIFLRSRSVANIASILGLYGQCFEGTVYGCDEVGDDDITIISCPALAEAFGGVEVLASGRHAVGFQPGDAVSFVLRRGRTGPLAASDLRPARTTGSGARWRTSTSGRGPSSSSDAWHHAPRKSQHPRLVASASRRGGRPPPPPPPPARGSCDVDDRTRKRGQAGPGSASHQFRQHNSWDSSSSWDSANWKQSGHSWREQGETWVDDKERSQLMAKLRSLRRRVDEASAAGGQEEQERRRPGVGRPARPGGREHA